MTQGFSSITIGGNPVPQVSLLAPDATPENSPKSIGGAERQQIMLCDPLTGVALDLHGNVRNSSRNIYIPEPADGTIYAFRVMSDFTLIDLYTQTSAGTTTVTLYQNGVALDAGLATTSVEAHGAYSVDFVIGDRMAVVCSDTSVDCGGLEVALGVYRDLT